MDFKEIAALTTGAVTLIGFIGTWIKIGISKGKSDAAIDAAQKSADKAALSAAMIGERMDAKLSQLDARIDSIKIDNAMILSKLETNIDWIKESIGEIKRKIDVRGA